MDREINGYNVSLSKKCDWLINLLFDMLNYILIILDRQWRNKNKSWKKNFIGLQSLVRSGYVCLFVCLSVCLFVCLSVHGLAPLPFDLEAWFFAWTLIVGIGKKGFFKFLNFYFFTELCPFFDFPFSIPYKLNGWLWDTQMS